MDFLESAAVLVPSLTGIAVTIYTGSPQVLHTFERRHCFSADVQQIYTAAWLTDFLEGNRSDAVIYELVEPLESRLVLFRLETCWVLLGPYVESAWDEGYARSLLVRSGIRETALFSYKTYRCGLPISGDVNPVRIAAMIIEHSEGGRPREVKRLCPGRTGGDTAQIFRESWEEADVVRERYRLENCFQQAVIQGDATKAVSLLRDLKKLTQGLRFLSDDRKDQIAGAAIVRTLVRKAAEQAGLTPVLVDSISQEYAQQMQHAVRLEVLGRLQEQMVMRFCGAVRLEAQCGYSVYVKKAVQYIDIHLSRTVPIAELAQAIGISRSYLVRLFGRETGMTVKQYTAARRCDIAGELLLDSGLSIQDVAAYVGYEDNNYFTKVFKANKGMTPHDYRNQKGYGS